MALSLEKDFEHFFNSLKKQQFSKAEIRHICKPLHDYNRFQKFKKLFLILVALCVLYSLIMWCDVVNWFISAVGRLFLIQLLPYWNWPDLYNAKCLIDRPMEVISSRPTATPKLNSYETDKENCLLCDSIDYIPSVSNTSSTFLENFYLERGFPVIITDSHNAMPPTDVYHLIMDKSLDFLKSNPCDVSTNLMLNKFFDIEIALRKAWNLNDPQDKWFLQLRNCQFKAVKSSRNFIRRPYYYPVHLEPFYSSWLIMSHNYIVKDEPELYLQGLIIVQQLWGSLDISLKPKQPCDNCPIVNVHLKERESLVFSTDLWLLSYQFGTFRSQSITTIMEIDWNF